MTTAGIGNPVLSMLEDIGSLGLTVVAFALPVLASAAVLALALLILLSWRRARSG